MVASEQDLFECFAELGIETTTYRHPPLHSVAESQDLRGDGSLRGCSPFHPEGLRVCHKMRSCFSL